MDKELEKYLSADTIQGQEDWTAEDEFRELYEDRQAVIREVEGLRVEVEALRRGIRQVNLAAMAEGRARDAAEAKLEEVRELAVDHWPEIPGRDLLAILNGDRS